MYRLSKSKVWEDVLFSSPGRFTSPEEAQTVVESLEGLEMKIEDVQQKQGKESAPRLFDLTSLQVEANKKWGWTADTTLRLIQSLYEKKTTTQSSRRSRKILSFSRRKYNIDSKRYW